MAPNRTGKLVVQESPPQVRLVYYPRKMATLLGAAQIILGMVSVVVMIPALVLNKSYMVQRASGIWCGVVYCIAGGITISAGISKNVFSVMASMVMSIFAAVFSTAMVFHVGGPSFSLTGVGGSALGTVNIYGQAEPALAILTGLAYIELIVATLTSTLGCMVTCSCCGGRSQRLHTTVCVEEIGQHVHHGVDSRIIQEELERRALRSQLTPEQLEMARLSASGSARNSPMNRSRSPTPQPTSPHHLAAPPPSYHRPQHSPTNTQFRPVEPAGSTQQHRSNGSPGPLRVSLPPDASRRQNGNGQDMAGTRDVENIV